MRCPDCAAEVSPLREFCPGCGAPTHPSARQHLKSRLAGGGRPPEELKRNRKSLLVLGGALLIAMAAFGKIHVGHIPIPHPVIDIDPGSGSGSGSDSDSDSDASRGTVTIGAPELFEAYHTDSVAANRRFGDRQMVVTGEFLRTVPDGYGSIDMRLKTSHPDLPLGIDLDDHSVDAATKLKAGQTVTVSCRRVAGSGDDPWLEDCVLQAPAVPGSDAGAGAEASAAPTPPALPSPPTQG